MSFEFPGLEDRNTRISVETIREHLTGAMKDTPAEQGKPKVPPSVLTQEYHHKPGSKAPFRIRCLDQSERGAIVKFLTKRAQDCKGQARSKLEESSVESQDRVS